MSAGCLLVDVFQMSIEGERRPAHANSDMSVLCECRGDGEHANSGFFTEFREVAREQQAADVADAALTPLRNSVRVVERRCRRMMMLVGMTALMMAHAMRRSAVSTLRAHARRHCGLLPDVSRPCGSVFSNSFTSVR